MELDFILEQETVSASTKNKAIWQIASFLANQLKKDSYMIYESMEKRECIANTGLEKGLALPHAIIPDLTKAYLCVTLFKASIPDWSCVDQSLVDRTICLVLPEEYSFQLPHLQQVIQIIRSLSDEKMINRLQMAPTSQQMVQLFKETLEEGGSF